MRTTVLKAMATVALFVAGSTSAVAQLRRENPPETLRAAVPGMEEAIQSLDIPDSQKSRLRSALPRIVGGYETRIEESAWQVALIKGLVADDRVQFCGGSIIDPEWVITAAHCMDNFIVNKAPARVNVVAGATNYKKGGERVAVKRVFVHPNWNSANMDNDVALLQLSWRLTLTANNMQAIAVVALALFSLPPFPRF